MTKIELLSPAKNKEIALEAIKAGADAVYMGAESFGARAKAANSLEDIEEVVRQAHIFGVKVYITLNTLLKEAEVCEAERLVWKLYDIGVDALIVQDMAFLKMNLPPIALHASTQCHIDSYEKARFMKSLGFHRIVLARELSLEEIRKIHRLGVEIECFIHGALCVCYSGQCYLSAAFSGRSGNRGECAQLCRLPYTLFNEKGKMLVRDRYLLSMKDFNASRHIAELLDAGAVSLKIEGRLKDAVYVKNVVAHYRKLLDGIMAGHPSYQPSSYGRFRHDFTTDLERSFHRPYTDFFLDGKRKKWITPLSPKSIGEEVGVCRRKVNSKTYLCELKKALRPGDGLCFFAQGTLQGVGVNAVEGNTLSLAKEIHIPVSSILYRNQDMDFEKSIERGLAERVVEVSMEFVVEEKQWSLRMEDDLGNRVESSQTFTEEAADPVKMRENIEKQCSKLGDTPFFLAHFEWSGDTGRLPFIPISVLNSIRRTLVSELVEKRIEYFKPEEIRLHTQADDYLKGKKLDYRYNVINSKAGEVYREAGAVEIAPGFEISPRTSDRKWVYMECKHCIKYELEKCPKYFEPDPDFNQNLYLAGNNGVFALNFLCSACRMQLVSTDKKIPGIE